MTYKQIMTLREIRLWVTMVIPVITAGAIVAANNSKVREGAEKVKSIFKR